MVGTNLWQCLPTVDEWNQAVFLGKADSFRRSTDLLAARESLLEWHQLSSKEKASVFDEGLLSGNIWAPSAIIRGIRKDIRYPKIIANFMTNVFRYIKYKYVCDESGFINVLEQISLPGGKGYRLQYLIDRIFLIQYVAEDRMARNATLDRVLKEKEEIINDAMRRANIESLEREGYQELESSVKDIFDASQGTSSDDTTAMLKFNRAWIAMHARVEKIRDRLIALEGRSIRLPANLSPMEKLSHLDQIGRIKQPSDRLRLFEIALYEELMNTLAPTLSKHP